MPVCNTIYNFYEIYLIFVLHRSFQSWNRNTELTWPNVSKICKAAVWEEQECIITQCSNIIWNSRIMHTEKGPQSIRERICTDHPDPVTSSFGWGPIWMGQHLDDCPKNVMHWGQNSHNENSQQWDKPAGTFTQASAWKQYRVWLDASGHVDRILR